MIDNLPPINPMFYHLLGRNTSVNASQDTPRPNSNNSPSLTCYRSQDVLTDSMRLRQQERKNTINRSYRRNTFADLSSTESLSDQPKSSLKRSLIVPISFQVTSQSQLNILDELLKRLKTLRLQEIIPSDQKSAIKTVKFSDN